MSSHAFTAYLSSSVERAESAISPSFSKAIGAFPAARAAPALIATRRCERAIAVSARQPEHPASWPALVVHAAAFLGTDQHARHRQPGADRHRAPAAGAGTQGRPAGQRSTEHAARSAGNEPRRSADAPTPDRRASRQCQTTACADLGGAGRPIDEGCDHAAAWGVETTRRHVLSAAMVARLLPVMTRHAATASPSSGEEPCCTFEIRATAIIDVVIVDGALNRNGLVPPL